jgi:hypothetical protein
MSSLIAMLLVVVAYFGITIAVIRIDAKRQRDKARAAGGVDFMDRSVTPYMILAFISGALPLIFYFGITRKKASGWLLGIGAFVAVTMATSILGGILGFVGRMIDKTTEHAANERFFARANAACAAPPPPGGATDPCRDVFDKHDDFRWAWNDGDGKGYIAVHEKACDGGRTWACVWLAHEGSFYEKGTSMASSVAWQNKMLDGCKKAPDPSCTSF